MLRAGTPLVIYGSGKQTRDFVNVKDVVSANMLAATTKASIGETFNVGSARPISIEGLATLEASLVLGRGRAPKILREPARPGDIESSCADISKIRDMLGFKPRVTLEKGLAVLLERPLAASG